jgi:PST family polysaccharide transporter
VQLGSQFTGTAILARVLAPGDFGLLNMSAIFLNVANALADFGVRAYIIHRPALTDDEIDAAKLVSWGLGLAIFLASLAAAAPLSWWYREPRLVAVLAVQAFVYVIVNAGMVHTAILVRGLSFRRLATADISSSVGYVVSATLLAFAGAGYWSMVLGRVAGAVLSVGVVTSGFRGLLPGRTSHGVAAKILKFGGVVSATGVVCQLDENFDNIVVGRALGAGALGLYSVGYNLAALPQRYLAYMIAGVVNPLVARQDDGSSLERLLVRYARYQLVGPSAVSVAFGVFAPEVVAILLGPRWSAAVPLVRIMSLSTALLCVATVVGGSLVSRGHARALFGFHVGKLAVTAIAVIIGLSGGMRGIALGFLAAAIVSLAAGLWFVEVRLRIRGVLRGLVVPGLLVGISAVVGAMLRALVAEHLAWSFGILLAAGLPTAAVHAALVLTFLPDIREDVLPSLRRQA